MQRDKIVELKTPPKVFNPRFVESMKADPMVLNLQEWCTHFYTFGIEYCKQTNNENLLQVILAVLGE
jgi:hypothetical protein